MLKEFKEFIMMGNVIELSVAVILASAVGGVVKGFTEYIMMPLVGQFTGGMDFSSFKLVLSPQFLMTMAGSLLLKMPFYMELGLIASSTY